MRPFLESTQSWIKVVELGPQLNRDLQKPSSKTHQHSETYNRHLFASCSCSAMDGIKLHSKCKCGRTRAFDFVQFTFCYTLKLTTESAGNLCRQYLFKTLLCYLCQHFRFHAFAYSHARTKALPALENWALKTSHVIAGSDA